MNKENQMAQFNIPGPVLLKTVGGGFYCNPIKCMFFKIKNMTCLKSNKKIEHKNGNYIAHCQGY
jgi:hypothetical protein